jgi:hypothetical protein
MQRLLLAWSSLAQYGGAAALNPFKDLPAEGPLFP